MVDTHDSHALRITDHIRPRPAATTLESQIRYRSYPRTEPPPPFADDIAGVFRRHVNAISLGDAAYLTTHEVLEIVRADLEDLGFDVERGKRKDDKIRRPVFFGDSGRPTLARMSQRASSRGRGETRGYKARAGRAPEAYWTIRRGARPSATP